MSGDFRHPEHAVGGADLPVVAFDFDGTLTSKDSFVAFFAWRAGPIGFAMGVASLAPAIASYLINPNRGRLKAAMARRFLGPIRRAELESEARHYARANSETLLRADALACWRAWRRRGARLYIVTASPEILVAPFAQALGADGLIGTRLAFDSDDRFAGVLEGPTVAAPRRWSAFARRSVRTSRWKPPMATATGDREMLAFARTGGLNVFTAQP